MYRIGGYCVMGTDQTDKAKGGLQSLWPCVDLLERDGLQQGQSTILYMVGLTFMPDRPRKLYANEFVVYQEWFFRNIFY